MKMTTTKALDDIRSAGQMQAINYGQPDGDALDALEDLIEEGYAHLRKAIEFLDGAGRKTDLNRAFWAGYRDGSD